MPEQGQLIHLRQRRGGMSTSIVGKASKYTIAALLVHAACDDLGLYVVTGHLGLFQRPHHRKPFEPRRVIEARIGVVGAPRAVWRAGSIILAGIIKQRRSAIPTYAA